MRGADITDFGRARNGKSSALGRLRRTLAFEIRLNGQLYLMILPVLVGFVLLKFGPIYGNIIAFQDYNLARGIQGSEWVGLENFQKFVDDPFFERVVGNTIILGFWQVVFQLFPPIILALSFNEIRRRHGVFRRAGQTVSQLPQFVAVVVVVGMMFDFFSSEGVVNQVIVYFGGDPIRFLNRPEWFRPLFVGSRTWQQMGWEAIIYSAALVTIDETLYEAAMVDGASRWRQLLHITLPSLIPVMTILFVKGVADVFIIGFERAYLLQTPATYSKSDVIQTYVYRRGLQRLDFSYGAAVGLLEGLSAFALVLVTNQIVKRFSDQRQGLW